MDNPKQRMRARDFGQSKKGDPFKDFGPFSAKTFWIGLWIHPKVEKWEKGNKQQRWIATKSA
ncbi:MAG: hypothetical protein ACI4MP_02725 [Candidatus Ventricola sp.]